MKVIIDCDPGNGIAGSDIDDGLAIALLAGNPEVELVGITVVAGNTAVEDGYASAHQMADVLGLTVPIVAGAWRALVEDPTPWIRRRSREAFEDLVAGLWSGVPAPEPRGVPASDDAAGFIIGQAHAHPGELTLVAVGPLTNVAMALQRDPELVDLLDRVIVMGGAFNVRSSPQELNFAIDPEAAQLVVRSGVSLTVVPLDTTLQTNLVETDMDAWGDSDAADYFRRTTRPWIRFIEQARDRQGCALHDPLAAALLLDSEVGSVTQWCVDVELRGSITRGRPVAWPTAGASLADGIQLPDVRPVGVLESVDNPRLLAMLASSLRRSEGRAIVVSSE